MTAEAESIHAGLLASVAAYSWGALPPNVREAVQKRVREGLQGATVALEEAAESLSRAAVAAAAKLRSSGGDEMSSAAAVNVLRQLQRGLSDRAAQKFQVTPESKF